VPHYLLEATLSGVLAQRLVRVLCPHCKADDGELAGDIWTNLVAGWPIERPARIWRPVGCPECRQTGYRGRTGLYELLAVTPAFSQLIRAETDSHALFAQGVADGMTPLRVAGARRIAEGATTAEEVLKVTAGLEVPARRA
jgi:general secretion pathway protein E